MTSNITPVEPASTQWSRKTLQEIREKHIAEYESVEVDVDIDAIIEYATQTILTNARTSHTMQCAFTIIEFACLPGRQMTKSVRPFMKQIRKKLKRRFPDVSITLDSYHQSYITVDWSDYE